MKPLVRQIFENWQRLRNFTRTASCTCTYMFVIDICVGKFAAQCIYRQVLFELPLTRAFVRWSSEWFLVVEVCPLLLEYNGFRGRSKEVAKGEIVVVDE